MASEIPMARPSELLESFTFAPSRFIQGRFSIADLFPAHRRCGIYVLHFANGELYVGQATDITRRYVQHCKTHSDICRISFKPMQQHLLNDEERNIIWTLEGHGYKLRNITFTSYPKEENDLDLVVSPQEQSAWLAQSLQNLDEQVRTSDVDLRRKYAPKWQTFLKKPAASTVLSMLQTYVQTALPYPLRTELSFWSCSCLPSYTNFG